MTEVSAGLISVPSFHAAAAVLFIWALWEGRARWPAFVLNLAMIFSALVIGSHYLVDIIAGIVVALFGIGLSPYLIGQGFRGRGRYVEAKSIAV